MSKARELASLGNAYSDGALSNRNKLINGDFSVWQRGAPITNSAGGSYFGADRWKGYSGSTRTFTQDTSSALSIGFPNCAKIETGAAAASFYNRIEDVRTLSGQTVTLSYYIKADAAHTPAAAYLAQSFGSGGSDTVFTYLSSPSVTTSWQRVVQTVTLPSVEGKTIGASSYLEVYPFTLAASQTYYITGVQLEIGDTATPFEHRSYGQELALCQRYYSEINIPSHVGQNGGNISGGYSVYTSMFFPFKEKMRAAPTIIQPLSLTTDVTGTVTHTASVDGYVLKHGNTTALYTYIDGMAKFDAEL